MFDFVTFLFQNTGQTTLEELINSLEENPENLTEPYLKIDEIANNEEMKADEKELDLDTGETIMHYLAKEGCVEVLSKILDLEEKPKIEKSKIVESIIKRDHAGWSPLMAAMKSERKVDEVLDLFLKFLEIHATTEDVEQMTTENPNVIFELLDSHMIKILKGYILE